MKVNLSENVIQLLMIYSVFSHEVGGALFGIKIDDDIYISALSLKHGGKLSINFSSDDKRIFYAPQGDRLIGTWHLHPNSELEKPSRQDIYQWKDWGCDLLHIIISKRGLTVFAFNAEVILKGKRV